MSRSIIAPILLVLSSSIFGAIFPDQIGDYTRSAPKTFTAPDEALYAEYGIEATEQADYSAPQNRKFTATTWRSRDTTGAMALFQARRPAGAAYKKLADLSATTSDGLLFVHGNYVFQLTGKLPPQA